MSRAPIGFVEALARRLAWRRPPADLPFRYVFVIAYARSGSTLLQKVLASLEGFHTTAENTAALHSLFFAYESAVRDHREQGHAPGDDTEPPDRADPIDPEHYARTLAQAFVAELVQPPARARLIGFHEMRYFDHGELFDEYMGFLATAFAPALIVFHKRNPATVAQSGAWQSYPRETVIAELERFDAHAAAYASAHPAGAIVLDYDVYARDPAALRPLLDRLGVPFDADAVGKILAAPLDP